MKRDYYAVLGVTPGSSLEEIKAAFRKLAHIYHPDKPGGNEEIYREVSDAYQTLSDEFRRRSYDAQRSSGAHDPVSATAPFHSKTNEKKEAQTSAYISLGVIGLLILIAWAAVSYREKSSEPAPSLYDPQPMNDDSPAYQPGSDEVASEDIQLGSLPVPSSRYSLSFSPTTIDNLGQVLSGGFGYSTYKTRSTTGTFMRVAFNGVNTGLDSISVRADSFVLHDQDGRSYYPDQVYNCSYPDSGYGQSDSQKLAVTFNFATLKPGIPCTWVLLFEVSNLSAKFTLDFVVR